MALADIVAGLLIGGVLGVVNALVLQVGVRFSVQCGRNEQRVRATLAIVGSYAIRYALIAVAIYAILKKGNMTVAITTLGVLGVMTIVLALIQRRRDPAGGRG
ncbi:MAG: ATP synthase subunit I [Kiritimatiellae bacterium]|nr:ATP synthase subunit I [Kiritimatiellia bacterium]